MITKDMRSFGTVAGVALVAALLAACGGGENVIGSGEGSQTETEGPGACPQFVPGANMLGYTWSSDGDPETASFVQMAGDTAFTADVAMSELAEACHDIAVVVDVAPPVLTDASASEQAQLNCTHAVAALADFKAQLGGALTTSTTAGASCDVEAATTACLATCGDDPTCGEYCVSSAAGHADCTPASVTIEFEGAAAPELEAKLPVLAAAVGRLATAEPRFVLLSDRLTGADGDLDSISAACVPVIIESLGDTVTKVEVMVSTTASVYGVLGLL